MDIRRICYFTGLVLFLAAPPVFSIPQKLTVVMVTGEVTYKRGKGQPRPVRKTTRLKPSDLIRTRVESSLEIRLDDGSLLTIEENSVVELAKLIKEAGVINTRLAIKTGKVMFNVKKLASKRSDFVFETPTATAAIRGTRGGIGTNGRQTYAFLEEGGLELKPRDGGKAVLIKKLNFALQSGRGFKVRTMANVQALTKVIEIVERAMEDSTSSVENVSVDTSWIPDSLLDVPIDTVAPADSVPVIDTTAAGVDTLQSPDAVAAIDTLSLPAGTPSGRADTAAVFQDSTTQLSFTVVKKLKTLELVVVSPAAGQEYPVGSDVTLAGTVTTGARVTAGGVPANVKGNSWNATVKGLEKGAQSIFVEAFLEDMSKMAEVSVGMVEKNIELKFVLISPVDGAEIQSSSIEVTGSATPGAKVKIRDAVTVADASGKWRLSLPAPGAPGEYTLSGEATLGGESLTREVGIIVPEAELALSVTSPGDGSEITQSTIKVSGQSTPGANIQVFEGRTRADGSGHWQITIQSPVKEGEYQLVAKAAFGSQSISEEITIVRVIPKQPLKGSVHPVPSNVKKPELTLSGTCNDGAVVEAGNFSTVSKNGAWTMKVAWPEKDEGTIRLEVYCLYNDEEAVIGEVETEYMQPGIPLALLLQTPANVTLKRRELTVRGEVKGRGVKVEVNGRGVPVMSNRFSYPVSFDESHWENAEVEVVAYDDQDEVTKIIEVEIDKSSPQINTKKPLFVNLPSVVNDEKIKYGLKDSEGDEVEVRFLVDGSEEDVFTFEGSATGRYFDLLAGVHDYRIEAVDMAGNTAVWERRNIACWPRVEWSIEVVHPRSDKEVFLPPSPPDRDFTPSYDVRIRIRSLPDDDYRYLKEVRIKNEANKAERVWRDIEIDDIEFEFENMELVPHQVNLITIRVEPRKGPIRAATRKITMR